MSFQISAWYTFFALKASFSESHLEVSLKKFASGQYAHALFSILFVSAFFISARVPIDIAVFPFTSETAFSIFAPISSRFCTTVFAESSRVSIEPFSFHVLT
jgi:hypothetical protein